MLWNSQVMSIYKKMNNSFKYIQIYSRCLDGKRTLKAVKVMAQCSEAEKDAHILASHLCSLKSSCVDVVSE